MSILIARGIKPTGPHHISRGVALPVVLVFILMLTMLALFSMRSAIFGEGISRNQLDGQIARQAAEAALRDAERDLMGGKLKQAKPLGARCGRVTVWPNGLDLGLGSFNTDCQGGLCAEVIGVSNFTTRTNPLPWWPAHSDATKSGRWNDALSTKPILDDSTCDTFTGGIPIGTFTGAPRYAGVARQPEYLIEFFRRGDNEVFRLTARGFGADERTEVVLQSHFQPPEAPLP